MRPRARVALRFTGQAIDRALDHRGRRQPGRAGQPLHLRNDNPVGDL
jgi:hypothetical protein